MYFAVGWPKHLHHGPNLSPPIFISSNQGRHLYAVLSIHALAIWHCKPPLQIVSFKRPQLCIDNHGDNCKAMWKPDSSMIAVTTTKGYILFYTVLVNNTKGGSSTLYKQQEERLSGGKKETVVLEEEASVVSLSLTQNSSVQVDGGITSCVCLREEIVVATTTGCLLRLKWDGSFINEMTINLATIPFSVDLQHSRASLFAIADLHVSDFEYHPLIGGFSVVLSDGKAAFITANTLKFEPSQVVGVWAQEVTDATTVAINAKYTLIAFGCGSGQGIVYHLDEVTGALVISHRLILSSKDFPDAAQICGGVTEMQWTPDGCALAIAYERGGFSLWSVFGSILQHSMGSISCGISDDPTKTYCFHIKSMEWGSEGYHLWVASYNPIDTKKEDTEEEHKPSASISSTNLLQMHFVKCALTVNPCVTNHQHLFLQGEDKLYLGFDENLPKLQTMLNPTNSLMGSRQWQIVPIPHAYLLHNWPIRFAVVNSTGHCVAVAGKTGLAHYALFSRKWRLFGNETQERDMVVTGGITWWRDFLCTACFNLIDQRDEIRFYPRDCKLDNTFSQVVRVPSQIMLLNTFQDILIVLCADCHVMIFKLERKNSQPNPQVIPSKIQEVPIGSYIPHPANVVALTLTSIRTDTGALKIPPQNNEAESIILNVAGKLFMFQRDRSGPQVKASKERPLPFCAPVVVASSVENVWSCTQKNERKPHLTEALWLSCGVAGMKVWLPLHHKEEQTKAKSFMSRRIMLPFAVDIYPLAMMFEAGIILGASSEAMSYLNSSAIELGWPYLQLEQTSQVYIHHILRQLLRRNLGAHAMEVARSCTDLAYFNHVLELLLHEILEEEATSKEPIPDPLLPRVVAFVQEFPQYLQTIVHCARKTEVALWQYLFSSVGTPKDLFEECLMSGELHTAGSYLIILQNLEKPIIARQHATLLLDASLENCEWDLAKDLVRFLKAIDPNDVESSHGLPKNRLASTSVYPTTYPSPPVSPNDSTGFMYPGRGGRGVVSKDDSKEARKDRVRSSKSDTTVNRRRSPSGSSRDDISAEQVFIDVILNKHARKLLQSYKIKDLARFAANLEDYQLVSWLRKERERAARVDDFVRALHKLHEDFCWPLPIISLSTLQRISSDSAVNKLAVQVNGQSHLRPSPSDFQLVAGDRSPHSLQSAGSTEVVLQPQLSLLNTEERGSLAGTEQSDTSGGSGPGEMESIDSNSWGDALCLSELEQVTQELANKGPQQSEVQLRYLYQIALEAGCLEWAILIATLLRDAMAVVRVVNTTTMADTPIEIIARMREGLELLEVFADTECFGYKPFLQAIQGQTRILERVLEQVVPVNTSRSSSTKRLSTSSTDSTGGVSVGEQSPLTPIDTRESPAKDDILPEEVETAAETEQTSSYECSVS